MKRALIVTLLLGFNLAGVGRAEEQCSTEREQFARLNQPMFVRAKSTAAEVAAYENTKGTATQTLHEFVVRSILLKLQAASAANENETAAVTSWIRCLQSGIPQYARASEWSNVPLAFAVDGGKPRVVVAYSIDRGYEAISQVTYFIEVYERERTVWKVLAGDTPHDFDASSLTIHPVDSSDPAEQWFLLTGKSYGDTAGRLRIEMLSFDGRLFRTFWSEVRPRTQVVSVSPREIVLNSELVDKEGRNAHTVTSAFRFERRALTPVGGLPK